MRNTIWLAVKIVLQSAAATVVMSTASIAFWVAALCTPAEAKAMWEDLLRAIGL